MKLVFAHYAHANKLYVQLGDTVKRGQIIGLVGRTQTKSPHLHFETRKDLYGGFNYYPRWKTRNWINRHYANPLEVVASPGFVPPMAWTHFGYSYLQWTGRVYHPGVDLNYGSAWQDYKMPFVAIQDGIVRDAGYNNGWGNHLTLECGIDKPLIERVNEALREAPVPVTAKNSEFFQAWVIAGKPGNYKELVDDIRGFKANGQYPFE